MCCATFFYRNVSKNKFIKKISFLANETTLADLSSIGIRSYFYTFLLSDGSFYNIHIIDTTGQERYRPLVKPYLNKVHVIIIMYDITNKHSFNEVSSFNELIKNNCNKNQKVILLGSKADLEEERQVSFEEGKSLAKLNNYVFMEVSCLYNKNIKEAMEIAFSLVDGEELSI